MCSIEDTARIQRNISEGFMQLVCALMLTTRRTTHVATIGKLRKIRRIEINWRFRREL